MSKIKVFAKSILIPVIIGGIVGILISKSIDYNNLEKPPLSPPSIAFPIVWTILYILMGVSYGILKTKSLVSSDINKIYYTQFILLWGNLKKGGVHMRNLLKLLALIIVYLVINNKED